jgi:uncharacterized protein
VQFPERQRREGVAAFREKRLDIKTSRIDARIVSAYSRTGAMATAVDSRIPEFVSRRLAEIEAVCRSRHVTRLELFGSAVTDNFDPARSDLDFVVEFDFSAENVNWLNVYFEFKESLETLFDRSVDLVSYRSVRCSRLRANIDEHRSLLYAA